MPRNVRIPYVAQVIDYWLDAALAEAFDENELCEPMWTRLLSAAKKSKMDGFVPRGAVVALNLRHWKRTLPILVRYGVVLEEAGGWRIRSWLGHNDSQAEIDAQLERKRKNLAEWRERNAGKPVMNEPEDCEVTGYEPDLVTGYEDDYVPGTNRGRHLTPDTRHLTSYIDPPTTPTELHPNEGGGGDSFPEVETAIATLAEAEADSAPNPIGNRKAWLRTVRDRIRIEQGSALTAAAETIRRTGTPGTPPQIVAEAERAGRVTRLTAGAKSWGTSRYDLDETDVATLAAAEWPDDPELAAAALAAWDGAQPATVEDVA